MAPAAASLLNPARYDSGVLTGLARLPALHLPFDYVSPGELVSVAGCAAAGAALAWVYLRAVSQRRSGCCAPRTPARSTTTPPMR